MNTIIMNSGNNKTSDAHRLLPKLWDKINLKRIDKCVALSNLSIYYTWKNIKKLYKINKFKISALTWNEGFELPHGPYSVSDIQDYFECILPFESHGTYMSWEIILSAFVTYIYLMNTVLSFRNIFQHRGSHADISKKVKINYL